MKLKLNDITINSFKGIKNKTINLSDRTIIEGGNGSGKTTTATSYSSVMMNKDYQTGKDNPDLFPIDMEEAEPRVIINMEVDGKPIKVERFWKKKVSKQDANGNVKTSVTSNYLINDVPKTERDFKAYFEELGINFELIYPLSHPNVFFSKKADEMRKVLYDMAGTYTDLEIAESAGGLDALCELLKNYSVEEIKAMQTATKRKISENYGKDGEIIRAKIEAKETAKIDVDTEKLLAEKATLKDGIVKLEEGLGEIEVINANAMKKKTNIDDAINMLMSNKNTISMNALNKSPEVSELELTIRSLEYSLSNMNRELEMAESSFERKQSYITSLQDDYKSEKAKKYTAKSEKCYACGQMLPKETVLKMMKKFESEKEERLEYIKKTGKEVCAERDKLIASIDELKSKIADMEIQLTCNRGKLETLKKEFDTTDVHAKIDGINKEIEKLHNEKLSILMVSTNEVDRKLREANSKISEIDRQLSMSDFNATIDMQIAELISMQRKFEQDKANCERILYQLDEFEQAKNNKLVNDINKHFEFVDFKLWETYKNGEYKPCCKATYKGKEYNISTNTGLELAMKLDVIRGLQKFYNQYYPVFIDNAECLSEETRKMIQMDCQTIWLSVSDGELTVRNE